MSKAYYVLPGYVEEIVWAISEREWLVHTFNTDKKDEIYNPSNYLYNAEFTETKYTLVLDLNVYQFLLNSVKKNKPHKNSRDAVALLVFCQITNVDIDPTFAVYEKVNYNNSNLDEALPDLELFHNINNSEMDELAKYALEFKDKIDVNHSIKIDHAQTRANLMKYTRLTEWDSLYLMMLSIVDIKHDISIPENKKLPTFLNWLIREFRRSLVAIVYAIVLFGKNPIKRMMKYKTTQNKNERRNALWNMTWDLYLMTQFFKKWTEKNENEEFLFASDDIAFCKLIRSAIDIQRHNNFDPINSHLTDSVYKEAQKFLETDLNNVERVYQSEAWGVEYRAQLITEYEDKLLNQSTQRGQSY